MFYPTLAATIVVLLYMHFVRAFIVLKVGKTYKARGGHHVTIRSKVRVGQHVFFTDDENLRYYANGECISDQGSYASSRLFELVA